MKHDEMIEGLHESESLLSGYEPLNEAIAQAIDQLRWRSVEDELPEFNALVWARLEGEQEHSGVSWHRVGMAEMVRHDPKETQFTVKDGWATCYYDAALKKIGADFAAVTHWLPLPQGEE